jgi:hypothetical protein
VATSEEKTDFTFKCVAFEIDLICQLVLFYLFGISRFKKSWTCFIRRIIKPLREYQMTLLLYFSTLKPELKLAKTEKPLEKPNSNEFAKLILS